MSPDAASTRSQRLGVIVGRFVAWRDRLARTLRPAPPPVPYDWFSDAEIAGYDTSFPLDDARRIDDATWRDLDAKALLRRLAGDASLYARQWLFHRLRRGDVIERGARPAWMGREDEAEPLLARTAQARDELRRHETDLSAILFHDGLVCVPARLRHVRWAKASWMLGLAAIAASWGGVGALLVAAYLVVYGGVELRFHARIASWKTQRRAVLAMLRALVELGEVGQAEPHPILRDAAAALDDARRLLRALDLDAAERHAVAQDYVSLLTLHAFASAPARIARLEASLPTLRALFATLAECEGRLCLLAHLRGQARWCWAKSASARELRLVAMANPLLDDAQPLSLALHREGVFLSGQNGVGKSTFLRGVGLNLLVARAFGFCYADEAALPPVPVWSSMVHEDSIAIGDSLYMAEMRRAQALLQVAARGDEAVFLVDEIFRGTNHVESVAGATAVLNRLAACGLLIVSSHSVVLAPLLRARLAPWCIVREGAGRLRIEPGVLLEPNGLSMMRRFDIDPAVRAEALRVHDWFAGHVATPVTFPPLA